MTSTSEVNTNIKHTIAGKNYTIYHDPSLKNPLSGFFVKVDDKKKKVKLTDLTAEKADRLKAVLKNSAKPPPGKKVNPLTGRFIKIGGSVNLKLNPKTFQDPISMNTVKKTDGIELNKTWYAKSGLRQWINSGKDTIPHTRRAFTNAEMEIIFTGKNGQKIPRKTNNNNYNNNSNNSNNSNNNNNYNTDSGSVADLAEWLGYIERDTPAGVRRREQRYQIEGDAECVIIAITSKTRSGIFKMTVVIIDETANTERELEKHSNESTTEFIRRVVSSLPTRLSRASNNNNRSNNNRNNNNRSNNNRNNNNRSNNNRSNNNRNFTTEYNYADDYSTVQQGGQKTFATFEAFKTYIHGLESEMISDEVGGIENLEIKIADRPGSVLKMDVKRMASLDTGGDIVNSWIDIYFDITRGGEEVSRFATDINGRSVTASDLLRRVNRVIS